ncbi:SHOCT domain-containing protein [Sporosarcina gallistercoris]|uniref:SHOCT domain-containing protein n=1 Tax=Sporosarcina gallistercoris TaxID=2762245 RepID=A0ABR8PMB2_9BACL|nr:SHOCT domain-containing protein [Sporosarcina gallistercoris]MBD7909292.1 SHOCT domain-containing protein [Sporosarcina gallistercoris]
MSWSVLGIFVLLVTWGFTKSITTGILSLLTCCALYAGYTFFMNHKKRFRQTNHFHHTARQEFFASELKRLKDLRESGLLTEDEFTVQNRLLSCSKQNSYIKS